MYVRRALFRASSCDRVVTVPHFSVVAGYCSLVFNCHLSAVATKSHSGGGFVAVLHHGFVTNQVHGGLAIKEDDLFEIKLLE